MQTERKDMIIVPQQLNADNFLLAKMGMNRHRYFQVLRKKVPLKWDIPHKLFIEQGKN